MRILATHKPSIIMIDDDVGMLYRVQKGCACPLHMAEFNKRAKTNMTREELYAHTQGTSQENKYYTDLYVQVQADALEDFVKAMREGIDMVDPTIQGAVSGIHDGFFCEFSDRTAKAFCGKNNPRIVRANNGCYTVGGGRWFSTYAYRVAIIKEYLKDNVDIIIKENIDYVIDAIDSVADKLALIKQSHNLGLNIISAMGAGNRCDIPEFKVVDISKTFNDGLAKIIRKKLREAGIEKHKVVFTSNPRVEHEGNDIGSIAYYPAMCGCVLSAYVINEIVGV